ncbi:hypothetical protein BD560DRAFT_25194 [Blakeslea trispora]|nr:hypothetical protein BD560DRAFT_25194 [Blakeslea trispora]
MGTALDENTESEQQGIIPRFINDLFRRLEEKNNESSMIEHNVYVSFLELYNEDFVDLLNAASQQQQQQNRKRSNSVVGSNPMTPPCEVQIREDVHGQIYWSGVREEQCSSPDELLRYLKKGSLCRTTGSTDMNSVSSRSHAIFSVILKQKVVESENEEPRTIVSKFHFVDLAGSERLKRTNAQGNRAREGISINSGLLALGNVISALGDESRKSVHVPYRDSKLTRLLQDSLGGNSQTLMMACVSPSDSNFLETLSTLKYANRARNIKNKVTINQEFAGSSVEVNQLRAQVARLKLELNLLKANSLGGVAGSKLPHNGSSSDMMINNMLYHQHSETSGSTAAAKALKEEIDRLKSRVRTMSDDICRITTERDSLLMERELAQHLGSEEWPNIMEHLERRPSSTLMDSSPISSLPIISQYQKTIQDLREELADTQERLVFSESIRAPLMDAMAAAPSANATPSPSFKTRHQQLQKQHSSTTNRRRNGNKKRRTLNGSTTTSRNVTFRSTKRSKVPSTTTNNSNRKLKTVSIVQPIDEMDSNDEGNEDIETWLRATLGSIQTSESSGLRVDAKQSINNAKSQIDKALKVLDEFKAKEQETQELQDNQKQLPSEYACSLLDDDELFVKLQSEDNQSIFGDIEDTNKDVPEDSTSSGLSKASHSRQISTDSAFAYGDDPELVELFEKNPNFHRMIGQIQSDIRVNEDLVVQLEKTEIEYVQMRKKFEKKLYALRDEIMVLRQQQHQQQHQQQQHQVQLQRKESQSNINAQNMNSIRQAYEVKMKGLMTQLSELRRKYTQTSSTIQSSRNQNESMLRALRANVETLKVEKKRMIKRMKDEAERVKEKLHSHEREIQQLRRKQVKDNEVKKKLEREVKQMQLVIGKKTDESVVTAEKLKSLVQILKKAVREGGVLDEKMLTSCSSLLDVGSAIVQSSKVGRISRTRRNNVNKANRHRQQHQGVPVEVRAAKKKTLLDNALYQLIQGKQAVEEMKQLLTKRNDLAQRKIEYMNEREMLVINQDSKELSSIDNAFRQVIDENIETIEAEISYLNARIHAINNDAAAEIMQEDENEEEIIDMSFRPIEKRVTFADHHDEYDKKQEEYEEDDWLDMDAIEERYTLPSSAGPEQSLEMISKILKSMANDEASFVMESVIDEIVMLRIEEHNNKMSLQQLEKSAQDLRRTLIVMKKAAIDTTIENEKKLKRLQLQQQGISSRRTSMSRELSCPRLSSQSSPTNEDSSDADSAIDLHNEDNYQHVESMFEKIYNDGLNGKVSSYEYNMASVGAEAVSPVTLAENELSPYLRPHPVQAVANLKNGNVQAPMKPSTSPLVSRRRDSMSSPEQFLMQMMQTPKDARPPASPLMKPAEFARYQQDRETSTNSSIRSRNNPNIVPRRSSVQSDGGPWSSVYSSNHGYGHQMVRASSGGKASSMPPPEPIGAITGSSNSVLNRRRAFSFQQPATNTSPTAGPINTSARRRSLLRELTNLPSNGSVNNDAPKSPLYQQQCMTGSPTSIDYSSNGTALIPAFSSQTMNSNSTMMSTQQSRPHSVLAMHAASVAPPKPVSKTTIYPGARRDSPNNSFELRRSAMSNNVFDRLSVGHTQASQAKKRLNNYRYSSSSIDDLRQQWANELLERNNADEF